MMFKRFRRSMRISVSGHRDLAAPQPVCHECGQSVRETISSSYGDNNVTAAQYDLDRAGMRDSWNSSSSSDSGYGGSSRHSALTEETHLDFISDDHSAPASTMPLPPLPLPRRRPTYNSSIYSETSTYENTTQQQIIVEEPAQIHPGPPVYDHLFDLPPRTYTNYSDTWKPGNKSRYSRLNELPAASPTAMAFPDDALAVDEESNGGEKEPPSSPEKKRMSLVLRPSSLRRLTSRRLKSH